MPAKKLYRLNDGDRQIMEKARVSRNPNWFTRFYLSSPDSGTYFRPVYPEIINKLRVPEFKEKAQKWADDYDTLYGIWHQIGRPRYFGCYNPIIGNSGLDDWFAYRSEEALRESGYEHKYRVIDDPKYTEPVFHNPHGHQLLPWQLTMHNTKQFLRVILGGYGCDAPWTKIYDARLKQNIPIEELHRKNIAPIVLAWTGTKFAEVQATVPFIKGTADLYEVKTSSGKSITVTQQHRLKTNYGWCNLREIEAYHPTNVHLLVSDNNITAYWDSISSIKYQSTGEFYDLHVPVYENYLAEGLINHNSGKTLGAAVDLLEYAATLKRFRALVLAPEMKQANDIFFALQRMLDGTEYEKRFLISAPLRYSGTNHPALIIGHHDIGRNTIEFLPIGDNVEKIKTFTNVDYIVVDQAEQVDELDTLIEIAGTRQRGQEGGREKLGLIALLANSAEGPIWEKFDQAEEQPDEVWAYSPSSAENVYLTVPDMLRYETSIGNDHDAIQMAIFGARPKGKGEIFTGTMLESFHADWMDNRTDAEVAKYPKAGVVKWLLPMVENRTYLVAADSGQENPPKRNSACIGIWDITNFPNEPASLWGFEWVVSNGSNEVWLNHFATYMLNYQTTLGAWDATGQGNAYNNPKTGLTQLGAVPIQMGGTLKMQYIGLVQLMMSQGKLRAPKIEGLFGQLSRYILPEKAHMAQDCVAMVLVTAAWLKPLFFLAQTKSVESTPERVAAAYDRWNRPDEMDRYGTYYDGDYNS